MRTARSFGIVLALAMPAASALALEIRTHTASELGFLASSHLILGRDEAILVDAQFTRSEAADLVWLIESSRRALTTVFITHARPEHYLGLEVVTARFPEARVLARPATVRAIAEEAADAIDRWRTIYLDDLPAAVVAPEPFTGPSLELDGVEISIHDLAGGPTVLYVASERTLLASDLAFGGTHPWVDAPPGRWLGHLAAVRDLGPIEFVYPGHGAGGGPELLAASETYLETLAAALAAGGQAAEVIDAMTQAYPEYRMPVLLEQSMRTLRGRRE